MLIVSLLKKERKEKRRKRKKKREEKKRKEKKGKEKKRKERKRKEKNKNKHRWGRRRGYSGLPLLFLHPPLLQHLSILIPQGHFHSS